MGGATGICVVRWWGVRGEDKWETLYDSSCTAHSTSQKCCTPPTNPNPNPKRNDTYTDIGEVSVPKIFWDRIHSEVSHITT